MRTTVGGRGAIAKRTLAPPISVASSSLTIFTTCWSGVSELMTSAPRARSPMAVVSSLTTGRLTSASSRDSRIARMARSMSPSLSRPRPRSESKTPWSLTVRASYIRPGRVPPVRAAPERLRQRDRRQVVEAGGEGGHVLRVHRREHADAKLIAPELPVGLGVDDAVGSERPRHPGRLDAVVEIDGPDH